MAVCPAKNKSIILEKREWAEVAVLATKHYLVKSCVADLKVTDTLFHFGAEVFEE